MPLWGPLVRKGHIQKLILHDLGFLEKSLQQKIVHADPSCLQIDPRWSLDAPWVLLDKSQRNLKNEKLKPEHLEICIMSTHDAS